MIIVAFSILVLVYLYGIRKLRELIKTFTANENKNPEIKYTFWLVIIYAILSILVVLLVGNFISNQIVKYYIIEFSNIKITSNLIYESIKESLKSLPSILNKFPLLEGCHQVNFYISNNNLLQLYKKYKLLNIINILVIAAIMLIIGIIVINQLFYKLNKKLNAQVKFEAIVNKVLLFSSLVTIGATFAIIISLFWETILFFEQVPLFNFLFGSTWLPQDSSGDIKNNFSVLPLLTGTFLIAVIACIVALIFALPTAIYMSEFMPKNIKSFVKPALEILSGIPTIVYGFFAALVLGPSLVNFFSYFNFSITSESAVVAGFVIGIMIIPFISSATDDIISSIPNSIREGGYALGSMSYEVVLKILLPISMPRIFSSFLLAFSRAIGETMIVVMASGLVAKLTFNPLQPVTTITTQIVTIAQGDQDFYSVKTLSLFALGFTLFCVTLLLNLFSFWIMKRFQVKY